MNSPKPFAKALRTFRDLLEADRIRLFPFLDELKQYDGTRFKRDAHAALSVTLLGLPQSIAYAAVAGLPIVYGILCASVASIAAPFFSGSRHTILGPSNATAFMLFSFFSVHPELAVRFHELVPLLVLMVGCIAVAGSVLRVADLLQYVSRSVLVGYISGAAVLIMANQLKPFLGISQYLDEKSTTSFVGLLIGLVRALPFTDWVPLSIGACTLLIYAAFRKWRPTWPAFAITLLLSSILFGSLIRFHVGPFREAETFVTFGFHDLVPRFPHLLREGIFNDISALVAVALAIAFLASLENTLMAKTISSHTGDHSDVNQDMFSVGMANLATSVAGGMPASASLSRSLLNYTSGAATRFASVFCGLFTLGLVLFTATSTRWGVPLIDYVPKASLAALVLALSLSLFNLRHIRICLNSTGDDALVLVVTFLSTLLAPLHVAIFVGVALSIALFLRKASQPHLVEYEFNDEGELRAVGEKRKRPQPAISIVHVEGDLFFGAAELFRTQIQRTVSDPALKVIILRMKNARHLDATSVMALEDLIHFMRARGLHLLISGASRDVYKILKTSGVLETLQEGCNRKEGESNLFLQFPSNPNLSTRDALKRAQQLIGSEKADIRIFYDPSH